MKTKLTPEERIERLHDRISELNNRLHRCETGHTHAHQLEEHVVGLKIALHDALDLAEKYMQDRLLGGVIDDYLRVLDVRKWAGKRPLREDE